MLTLCTYRIRIRYVPSLRLLTQPMLAFPARPASFWVALWLGVLASAALPARAGVTEAWIHRYSNILSNADDEAYKVVLDAAGNVIVFGDTDDGVTSDLLTIKYSGVDGS